MVKANARRTQFFLRVGDTRQFNVGNMVRLNIHNPESNLLCNEFTGGGRGPNDMRVNRVVRFTFETTRITPDTIYSNLPARYC